MLRMNLNDPKLILGACGEIGKASNCTQTGDLIVEVKHSKIKQNRPVYLLARRSGKIFNVVGRVFLCHENNQVLIDPSITEKHLGPVEDLILSLDIRSFHRLAMMTV